MSANSKMLYHNLVLVQGWFSISRRMTGLEAASPLLLRKLYLQGGDVDCADVSEVEVRV